jgi:ABC-2 type transport system permease protein
MQVFKLCLKILKKNIPSMLIYLIIFMVVSLIMSSATASDQQKDNIFTTVKSDIVFISEETSPLIDGLKNELGKIANFIEIPDETEALQDALYFRSVSYILRIPKGFTESFISGENVHLEKTTIPNSIGNTYIDLSINKYLNTAKLYIQHMNNITQESLSEYLQSDLAISTSVEMQTNSNYTKKHTLINYFFNYLSYTLISVLILGMSTLMLVFNNNDLKRRNVCSPLSANTVNMQFILATLLFTLVSWLVMVIFCFIFNYRDSFNNNTVYFIVNSFVFAICGASISFLIGNLVKSREAISAVSNVVTLGTSFISGVFVPQEFLGDTVLKIASFTPTYWYVDANNRIAELTQFDITHMEPVLRNMLIQFGFALAFFAIALVIAKHNRVSKGRFY